MTEAEQNESVAIALAALVRVAQEQRVAGDAGGRARLLLRAEVAEPRRGSLQARWLAWPAFAIVCALLVYALTPSRLSYRVAGTNPIGSYVSAPPDHSVLVEFSDQTRVVLASSSQLRVEDTTGHGARVLLERGAVDVRVVHRERAAWTFAAGPFDVRVTGTRFDLNWDPTAQIFELRLREGAVEIQSPLSPAPLALRAGQTFHGDLARHTLTTAVAGAALPSARRAASASAPNSAASAGASTASETTAALPSRALASALPVGSENPLPMLTARAWPKLIAEGEFKVVLEQANERGVASCLRSCSSDDLSALADAARYSRQNGLAEQSLLALRARFLRETAGRSAAFLLGRLREGQGAANDAKAWYERYSSETPNGSYAAEALAGKMRSVLSSSGAGLAAPIAEDYLRRYPNGVHAATARSTLDSH